MRMILKKLLRLWRVKKSGWQGDYASWEDAEQLSKGYDAVEIAEKVLASTLKVKNGEAVFERDSVIFDKIEYINKKGVKFQFKQTDHDYDDCFSNK